MKNKTLITLAFLLIIATMTFAQRANWQWSDENVQTISGTVTDNSRPCGFLKADDGKVYRIHMGPVWFWDNNNYALALTNATIKGNVKESNGEYDIFPFTITQNSKTMIFSDDNGIPKWSQGNGRGKGYGWKGNGRGWGRGYCWRNNDGYGWGRGNNPNCPYRNK